MTREKAVKVIKEFINGTCLHLVDQEALETLIPELKENEDERMMREFNDWLCEEIECLTNDLRDEKDRRTLNMLCYVLTKVKDWLEKQKEQKQEWSESDKQNINLIISYLDSYIKEHNDTFGADECKYLKYWLKSLPLNLKKKNEGVAKLCSNEWSEEDDVMFDKVCCLINPGTKLTDDNSDYCAELKQWIVSLRERMLKFLRPQLKQELSEEDSDNLERVENYLWMLDDYVGDDCAMPQGKTDKIRENIQEILLPWIKSLPERFNLQPKQEWSEKEYGKLFDIEHYLDGTLQLSPDRRIACIDFLKSLYTF